MAPGTSLISAALLAAAGVLVVLWLDCPEGTPVELDATEIDVAGRGGGNVAAAVDLAPTVRKSSRVAAAHGEEAGRRGRGGSRRRDRNFAAVARGSRSVQVQALDGEGCALSGMPLRLFRTRDGGGDALVRSASTDVFGRATFHGLKGSWDFRVAAVYLGAPEPVEVPADGAVELLLQAPGVAQVTLQSRGGDVLSGARRVRFEGAALRLSEEVGCWELALAGPAAGELHVVDSLGTPWTARVALAPGVVTAVSPAEEWIAISPVGAFGGPARVPMTSGRLRWSLRVGDGRARQGSGRLAPSGGFHAVVSRAGAREGGGHLALRWDAAPAERRVDCVWHPDPTLDHLELHASPIGEVLSSSTRNE